MTFLIEAHSKLHEARVTTLVLCEYFRSFVSALNRTAYSGGELGSNEVSCSSYALTAETAAQERNCDSDVLHRHLENLS